MEYIIDNVLVVKVGTNTLIEKSEDGSEKLDIRSFRRIGHQLIELKENGHNVVVVSSAAITAGMMATDLTVRPSKTEGMANLQRLASIGWRHVLNVWGAALSDIAIGELLLTKHELEIPTERDEALRTTHELMSHGDIAIANENDAITHAEIAFGDNDTLAATFAAKIRMSNLFGDNVKLVLLSDVDGVYKDAHDSTTLIRSISDLTQYEHLALGTDKANGTGGMATKFQAARIAAQYDVEMFIANGRQENVLQLTLNGQAGTRFI